MSLVDTLLHFDLTRQEAVIYLELLTQGELTGYEVAKLTGISRSNTYTSLASLVEKGAAYVVEGSAIRYTPVAVEEFCGNRLTRLEHLRDELVHNMPRQRKESEGYITIKGGQHILDKLKNMLHHAQHRIYLSICPHILATMGTELTGCIERGLKVVVITDAPFELPGAVVYHSPRVPDQIRVIVDSEDVLTGEISEGDDSTCLYSRKRNLIDVFKESLKNEIELILIKKGT